MTVRRLYVPVEMLSVSGAGYDPQGEFSHEGSRRAGPDRYGGSASAAALASDAHLVREDGRLARQGRSDRGGAGGGRRQGRPG